MEQEQLRWVAQGVATLVGGLLSGNKEWGKFRWVDYISPSSNPPVLGPGQITLEGLLIFGELKKASRQWWEPFYGRLRISDTTDEIVSYELMFGDVAWGLGKVKYNERPKGWNSSRPNEWIFVFSKP